MNTPPQIKISAYKAWKGKPGCKPYDTDFYTEMDRIKNGYHHDIVAKCRQIQDEKKRSEFKVDNLPSLTISAVCKEWRKKENVINHTGLLNIDIDQKANTHIEDWPALRDSIFGMKGVVACFLSVSGQGVTFVVRVKPEQHKDTFFSIVDGMKQHFNVNVDAGLHDVTRLRFVSDDPGCKIRYDFDLIPISEPSEQYLANKKSFGDYDISIEPIGDADSEYNFSEAIKRASTHYTFSQGQKWSFLVSVAGSCNIMGMSLEFCKSQVLERYSKQTEISKDRLLKPVIDVYKIYKHQHGSFNIEAKNEVLNKKIKSILIYDFLHEGRRPTDEELLEICEAEHINRERAEYVLSRVFSEYEEEFGYNKFPAVRKVEIWLQKRYQFQFNRVTMQPESIPLGSSIIEQVNADEIYRQLQKNSIKYGLNNVKSLMKSEFMKPYDPILDYFRNTTYDEQDHISVLASHIKTDDGGFWEKQFKKCLVRSIACGLGKKENRLVMVLYGQKQETGKSTFIRFLSPFENGQYFTESPIIGGNQKDTEIRFSENFIYNIEELAGLNRADVNKLKADISKAMIKERRAYASHETSAPRRCNFWASTNQKEFLHDEENTRWLVFNTTGIDWSYKSKVDIHKVWGQAWHLYNNGFNFELDTEDRAIREYLNQEYRYMRPEEELIARHFRPASKDSGQFYSATEIAIILNRLSPNLKINSNNIGKTIMSAFDLESVLVKIQGKVTRGYWLTQIYNQADGERPPFPAITSNLPF